MAETKSQALILYRPDAEAGETVREPSGHYYRSLSLDELQMNSRQLSPRCLVISKGANMKTRLPKPECVIKVGDGRGFLLHSAHYPHTVVVTAAHCLPSLPPAHPAAFWYERTYPDLLGPLTGERKIWTECMFVDPVNDIAVLGTPEPQELYEQARAYDDVIYNAPVLRLSSNLTKDGWVMTLDREWVPTPLHVFSGLYGTSLSIGMTKAGMSGSPILNTAGWAVGLVAVGAESCAVECEKQGPQPILYRHLPGWCLPHLKSRIKRELA